MRNLPLDYIDVVDVMPRPVAGLCQRVPPRGLSSFIDKAIPAVMDQLSRVGIRPTGPLIVVFRREWGATFTATVGFPVQRASMADALVHEHLPGGPAVRCLHTGPEGTLPATYRKLTGWLADRNLILPSLSWEEHLVGSDVAGESGRHTRVVFPIG
jgi:effector-binding domain-containing protein